METIAFIILAIFYFSLYSTVLWGITFLRNRKEIFDDPIAKEYPRVSIIIPAYNEQENIARCVDSCLNLDYPKEKISIIVVNDGSADRTKEICEGHVKEGAIKLLNKKNGGKASAMNLGLKHADTELIAYLDADSFYLPQTMKHLVGYMDEKNVGAVTTSMKTNKQVSFMEKIQWVEYIFSIYMRKLFDIANTQYVIPGPGSLYRKEAIAECGGFDETSLTEDMEIAFKMHNTRYVIRNSVNAYVVTEVPERFKGFLKQRLRWYVGYFDNVGKYRYFFLNKKFGNLGMFLIPSTFLWLISTFFLVAYWFKETTASLYSSFQNFSLVNWDILLLFNFPTFSSIYLYLNIISLFSFILLIISLVVISFSLNVSRERVDVENKYTDYALFIMGYLPIMALVWGLSFLHKLFIRRDRKGWH